MPDMFESGESGERTESATPRRRAEAAREGRVPRSVELSAASVLFASTLVMGSVGAAAIGRETTHILRSDFDAMSSAPLPPAAAQALIQATGLHLALALWPFALAALTTALTVGLIQGRGVVSAARITPKLSNLDPRRGLQRIVGFQGVYTLGKAMLKLAALVLVTFATLHGAWPQLTSLGMLDIADALAVLRQLAVRLVLDVSMAFFILAGVDYAVEVYRYEQSLRMSKQEIKRESRETDGDPLIKARIRSLMRSLSRKRMLRDVARADVVVTNPTHIAVALRYDITVAPAPIVIALGERKLAERIKMIARDAGVPLIENKPLAQALRATATVGLPIPVALYAAVAEVLAFVYRRRAMVTR
jgi:flagellar biosynthesis protein FlhB